jgi:hypothetical protein
MPDGQMMVVASNLTVATYVARMVSLQEKSGKSIETLHHEVLDTHDRMLDALFGYLKRKHPEYLPPGFVS